MKKVFNDQSQIAHLWANQHQTEARNSNNSFYFYGSTIYSYGSHFAIAKHTTNEAGEVATLFTTRSYSNTTAKHINITRQAARNKNLIFCPFPTGSHSENFERWYSQIKIEADKLQTARKPEKYLNEINYLSNQVTKYSQFFNAEIPVTLQQIMAISNKAEYLEFNTKLQAYKKAEEKRKVKEAKKQHKKQLEKFMNFEINRVYSDIKIDYLRLNKAENRIETTQAVQIPVEAAKRLYFAIANNSAKIGDQILNYSIEEINSKTIKIGCHNFEKKYLLTFGKNL